MTYLITFACYGRHLHGDEHATVDRLHNVPGTRDLIPDPRRASLEAELMLQPAYELDGPRRKAVLESMQEVCSHRRWRLLAAHVRSTHVHAIVETDDPPEKIMNAFKSYASRRMNLLKLDDADRKRWARHGSTRWSRESEEVTAAIHYVVDGQGEPMAVFQLD